MNNDVNENNNHDDNVEIGEAKTHEDNNNDEEIGESGSIINRIWNVTNDITNASFSATGDVARFAVNTLFDTGNVIVQNVIRRNATSDEEGIATTQQQQQPNADDSNEEKVEIPAIQIRVVDETNVEAVVRSDNPIVISADLQTGIIIGVFDGYDSNKLNVAKLQKLIISNYHQTRNCLAFFSLYLLDSIAYIVTIIWSFT